MSQFNTPSFLIFAQTLFAVILARKFAPSSWGARSALTGFLKILLALLIINAIFNLLIINEFDAKKLIFTSILLSIIATIGGVVLKTIFQKFGLTAKDW